MAGKIEIPQALVKPCAEPDATGGLGEFALRLEAARICERDRADTILRIINAFNGERP